MGLHQDALALAELTKRPLIECKRALTANNAEIREKLRTHTGDPVVLMASVCFGAGDAQPVAPQVSERTPEPQVSEPELEPQVSEPAPVEERKGVVSKLAEAFESFDAPDVADPDDEDGPAELEPEPDPESFDPAPGIVEPDVEDTAEDEVSVTADDVVVATAETESAVSAPGTASTEGTAETAPPELTPAPKNSDRRRRRRKR